MSSKSYKKFQKTINRCESLIDSYEELYSANLKGEDTPAPKDIVRGAVVLAVAALDAYVTDVFAEKLVAYLKTHGPNDKIISLLADAGLDTEEALQLLTMDRPYRRINTLIRHHYSNYTTQQFDVIDDIFLCYRLTDLTKNAEKKAGRKTLRTSVKKLIKRRHRIAHGGDYNQHGRLRNIDQSTIGKRIKDVDLLVEQMDEIVCSRI